MRYEEYMPSRSAEGVENTDKVNPLVRSIAEGRHFLSALLINELPAGHTMGSVRAITALVERCQRARTIELL